MAFIADDWPILINWVFQFFPIISIINATRPNLISANARELTDDLILNIFHMNVYIQPAIIGILFPLCTFALDLLQKRDLFGIADFRFYLNIPAHKLAIHEAQRHYYCMSHNS